MTNTTTLDDIIPQIKNKVEIPKRPKEQPTNCETEPKKYSRIKNITFDDLPSDVQQSYIDILVSAYKQYHNKKNNTAKKSHILKLMQFANKTGEDLMNYGNI